MRIYKPSFWSLAFPIGIIIYSAYKLIELSRYGMGLGSGNMLLWCFAGAIVLGGILPIILTFALKLETREYCLPRLILYILTIAAVAIPQEFVVIPPGGLGLLAAASAAVTLLYFYRFHTSSFKEWCVIFLSTPQIYMMIYYFIYANYILDIYDKYGITY